MHFQDSLYILNLNNNYSISYKDRTKVYLEYLSYQEAKSRSNNHQFNHSQQLYFKAALNYVLEFTRHQLVYAIQIDWANDLDKWLYLFTFQGSCVTCSSKRPITKSNRENHTSLTNKM